jgi:CBS domain-containing protein
MVQVSEVMTANPRTVTTDDSLTEAAKIMRDEDVGAVIVTENQEVCGIVTDRDIAIRAIAEGKDPSQTAVDEVCSQDVTVLSPDQETGEAVRLMTEKDIRRLPVVEDGKPVGIVSLGDLAQKLDPESALADISAAPPNE